jgi:CRISPR system Cascade subunit CasA
MANFNLVDAPWIPCAERAGGMPQLLGLREVFTRAPHLANIADPSPAVTISLYRLLIAILHRSLDGPRNGREWRDIWLREHWDLDAITRYLHTWRGRFDLFDGRHPFYQTPELSPKGAKSATQLAHERASDRNRPLLFDHSCKDSSLSPAEAAGYLLAQQNFAVGGLISYDSQREPIANKYTSSAPLLGGAVVLARGDTLFQTLMLNWPQYSRADEAPFAFGNDDQPAWERDGARPEPRLPDGHVDLLTWQCRRILLVPDVGPDGTILVRDAILMKGYYFSEAFDPHIAETMMAFKKSAKPDAKRAWFPVGLDSNRVVWRDSHALFQSVAGATERPKTLDWLTRLMGDGVLDERRAVPVEVFGLIPDQATIEDWRHETLPLPLRLLKQGGEETEALIERLDQAITFAEDVGKLFDVRLVGVGAAGSSHLVPSPIWRLCEALLAGTSDREPRRDDCAILARSFDVGLRYWARLNAPFRAFVLALPDDISVDEYGEQRYGAGAVHNWVEAVMAVAWDVFDGVIAGLDTSARALRASAQARSRFRSCLAALVAPN